MKQKIEYIESYIKSDGGYQFLRAERLTRCKDCTSCIETKLSDGQRWNYCGRLRRVTEDDDYCAWAEPKETE